MVNEPTRLPPSDKIIPALVHHYTPAELNGVISGREKLVQLLNRLPALSTEDHIDTIATQLTQLEPGAQFEAEDRAIITFVDDAVTEVLNNTDLDFKVESFVRNIAPRLAALALENDLKKVTESNPLFQLIDLLMEECIGWSEDLGILGQQFMEKIETVMNGFDSGRLDGATTLGELKTLFKKEAPNFHKLEQRLCDRELKVLAGLKAHFYSTQLLNREMSGQKLPLFIIFMLQGPWFKFLQDIYLNCGEDSKEWQNIQKITEAMIWSLQPGRDAKKLGQVMSSVPDSVRKLCQKADFETDQVENSLAELETEYQTIRAGEPSEPCDFALMDVDEDMSLALQSASRDEAKAIRAIPSGQWFLYDDPDEPEEKVARIKLILNWTETEQLLLTNHNRRKVVHMSYGMMTNQLASGVLRKLNPVRSTCENFRLHLLKVLKAVSDQNRKEKKIKAQERRRVVSAEYTEQRKADLVRQVQRLEEQAAKKKQRAMVLRHKAQKKLQAAVATVSSLRQDAWVKLPIMEGTLTPCKLVAVVSANNTYIFANRAGLKVAQYTGSQLAHMIVTENSEILDTGAEFENALATVVSGLREGKNKSYDELTGDTG